MTLPARSRLRRASNNALLAERTEPPFTPLTWPGGALEPPTDVYAEVEDGAGRLYRTPNYRTPDSALFRYAAGDNIAPLGGTFTRASSATYVGADGVVRTAAAGVLRDAHYVRNPVTGMLERSVLLEGQRTNLLPWSADFAKWSLGSTTSVSSVSGAAPDGGAATRVTATGAVGGSTNRVNATIDVSPNTAYTFSLYMKGESAVNSHIAVRDATANTTISEEKGTAPNGWERRSLTFTTPAGCTQVTIYAAWSQVSGTQLVWGAQLEAAPFASSYIATAGFPVTRAADSLSFAYPHPPQEMSVYARFVEQGGGGASANFVLALGGNSVDTDGLAINARSGGRYEARARFGGVNVSGFPTPTTLPVKGDLVEARMQLAPGAPLLFGLSQNRGAENVAGSAGSVPAPLPAAWGGEALLSRRRAFEYGFNAFTHFLIAPRVRTMAEMRRLAGVTP